MRGAEGRWEARVPVCRGDWLAEGGGRGLLGAHGYSTFYKSLLITAVIIIS